MVGLNRATLMGFANITRLARNIPSNQSKNTGFLAYLKAFLEY